MNSPALGPGEQSKGRSRVGWLIVLCLVLLLAALSRGRRHADTEVRQTGESSPPPAAASPDTSARDLLSARLRKRGLELAPTATEIVSNKVAQFARDRHEILDRMARKLKQEVPDEVKRFFEAAEAGNWEELDSI